MFRNLLQLFRTRLEVVMHHLCSVFWGHSRLRTWIPIIIIIQCGLIIIYISVIQDKNKAASATHYPPSSIIRTLEPTATTQASTHPADNGNITTSTACKWISHANTSGHQPPGTGNGTGRQQSPAHEQWSNVVTERPWQKQPQYSKINQDNLPNFLTTALEPSLKNGGELSRVSMPSQSINASQLRVDLLQIALRSPSTKSSPSFMERSHNMVDKGSVNVTLTHTKDKQQEALMKPNGNYDTPPRSTNNSSVTFKHETYKANMSKGDLSGKKDTLLHTNSTLAEVKSSGNFTKLSPPTSAAPLHVKYAPDSVVGRNLIKGAGPNNDRLVESHKAPLFKPVPAQAIKKQFKKKNSTLVNINSFHQLSSSSQDWNSSHGSYPFKDYDPTQPHVFQLMEDNNTYFSHCAKNLSCLVEGTDNVFVQGEQEACICKAQWNGAHCSVHDTAMYTSALRYMNTLQILPHHRVRRIIHAINFNVEWELLEARLYELGDLVDVYILVESNFTQYGEKKPLRLLERLRNGYLKEFQSKISYLFVNTFPERGKENGWIVDQFARTYIGNHGLSKIQGLRPDDIFIYTDADEIPSHEVILFLKLHHGYPEPFGLALRWSVFGFFWKQYDLTRIMVGCSIEMLRDVFQNDVYKLRTGGYIVSENNLMTDFVRKGGVILDWYFGDGGSHAGWHCSWCMAPQRIQVKLTSALNADFPRWGDYPEKRDLTYIRNLIKTGTWFDDKTTFNSLVDKDSDTFLAPSYMLRNFKRYEYLLDLNYVK